MMSDEQTRAVPKVFRRKNKFGQEHGNFSVKVGKKKVDLQTEDYIVARERAREAFYDGKTEFNKDRFYDKTDGAETVPASPVANDWTADLGSAVGSLPDKPTEKPDQYSTPQGRTVPLLPAAPDTPDDGATTDSAKSKDSVNSGDSTQIPPEMFAGMIKQLAAITVELQIKGQEWLFERYGKVQAGTVPMNSFARTAPTEMWEAQFRKWLPEDVPLPEYLVAPLLCAMLTLPLQMEGMRPLAKDVPIKP